MASNNIPRIQNFSRAAWYYPAARLFRFLMQKTADRLVGCGLLFSLFMVKRYATTFRSAV